MSIEEIDETRIHAADVLNIVKAAGKKPRHAQALVVKHVFNGSLKSTSSGYIENGNLTIQDMLRSFFTKHKINVEQLSTHADLTPTSRQHVLAAQAWKQ